jgi:hypothetical protein
MILSDIFFMYVCLSFRMSFRTNDIKIGENTIVVHFEFKRTVRLEQILPDSNRKVTRFICSLYILFQSKKIPKRYYCISFEYFHISIIRRTCLIQFDDTEKRIITSSLECISYTYRDLIK